MGKTRDVGCRRASDSLALEARRRRLIPLQDARPSRSLLSPPRGVLLRRLCSRPAPFTWTAGGVGGPAEELGFEWGEDSGNRHRANAAPPWCLRAHGSPLRSIRAVRFVSHGCPVRAREFLCLLSLNGVESFAPAGQRKGREGRQAVADRLGMSAQRRRASRSCSERPRISPASGSCNTQSPCRKARRLRSAAQTSSSDRASRWPRSLAFVSAADRH